MRVLKACYPQQMHTVRCLGGPLDQQMHSIGGGDLLDPPPDSFVAQDKYLRPYVYERKPDPIFGDEFDVYVYNPHAEAATNARWVSAIDKDAKGVRDLSLNPGDWGVEDWEEFYKEPGPTRYQLFWLDAHWEQRAPVREAGFTYEQCDPSSRVSGNWGYFRYLQKLLGLPYDQVDKRFFTNKGSKELYRLTSEAGVNPPRCPNCPHCNSRNH
jgi:hypothetical protein